MSCCDIIIEVPEEIITIEMTPEGKDGKSIRPMGEWSDTVRYLANDLVSYQGSSYVALKTVPAGTLPTDTGYWMVSASAASAVWGAISGTLSDQTDLRNALDAKANAADVYTKTEVDDALDLKADKADVYTKTELDGIFDGIDNALYTKADKTDVYTKTQTDNLLSAKADASTVYTKTETDDLLSAKADSDDVYTKAETDTLLSDKADADDVYTKTETDTLLGAKANTADLGTLATKNSVDYETEVTNKPTLGNLASQDTVDYDTQVTNRPTLGTMAGENASDYYDKTATDALLAEKADIIKTSASGSIVSISDGAVYPVDALTVGIEPVQDLHGYANPWPAGGGKNLLNLANSENGAINTSGQETMNTENWRSTVFIPITAGETYTLSAKSSLNATARLYWYDSNQDFISPRIEGALKVTATAPNNAAYAKWTFATVSVFTQEIAEANDLQLERGSTVTSYAPYSNVCPISGHTQTVVTRTGKNLLDCTTANRSDNTSTLTKSEGVVNLVNTSATRYCGFNFFGNPNFINKLLPKTTYTLSFDVSGTLTTNWSVGLRNYVTNTFITFISVSTAGHYSVTFSTDTSDNCYLLFTRSGNSTANVDVTFSNLQIELGSTATAYASYQGTSITIDLDGTIYGATIDVLSGVMTVTDARVNLASLAWSWNSTRLLWVSNSIANAVSVTESNVVTSAISEYYMSDSNTHLAETAGLIGMAIHNNGSVRVRNGSDSVTPVGYLVYPLKSQTTVQLSPATLSLILGDNNIWADTGDTSVGYRADTKLYIERLTKPSEDDMTANVNIASGKFFMVGNNLYYSTASIASGEQIVPGTNCTALSLADALNNLNS